MFCGSRCQPRGLAPPPSLRHLIARDCAPHRAFTPKLQATHPSTAGPYPISLNGLEKHNELKVCANTPETMYRQKSIPFPPA